MRQHLYGLALHRLCTRNRIRSHLTEIQGVSLKANRYIAEKIKPSKCLQSNTVRTSVIFFFLWSTHGQDREKTTSISFFSFESNRQIPTSNVSLPATEREHAC